MKEVEDLLAIVAEKDVQRSAGIGAAVGALLGDSKASTAKNAVLGAGAGAALAWLLNQYELSPKVKKDSEDNDQQ